MVSIIIPTFNRNELLELGLQSLDLQFISGKYEILVLNEYLEGDGSKEICLRHRNVKYILTRKNGTKENIKWRCPGMAINIGVKLSQFPNIIITSPEIYHFDRNNIRNIVEPLLSNSKLMVYTEGIDDRGGKILKALKFDGETYPQILNNKGKLTKLHTQYPFFMGINKEEFVNIGGYDERFQDGYCFDDTDYVSRMLLNGCNYLQVSGLIVHLYHSRLRLGLPKTKELWNRNEKLYAESYGSIVRNKGKEWGKLG